MTEIDDLNPAPRPAAPEALSPGQVALYLKEHGAERPCEACGSTDWVAYDERTQGACAIVAFAELGNQDSQAVEPVVRLTCEACGLIRTFLRERIVRWLAAAMAA